METIYFCCFHLSYEIPSIKLRKLFPFVNCTLFLEEWGSRFLLTLCVGFQTKYRSFEKCLLFYFQSTQGRSKSHHTVSWLSSKRIAEFKALRSGDLFGKEKKESIVSIYLVMLHSIKIFKSSFIENIYRLFIVQDIKYRVIR